MLVTVAALAAVSGCGGAGKPWDGVGPKELQAIEQHRNLGIALFEIAGTKQPPEMYNKLASFRGEPVNSSGVPVKSSMEMAADEFRAITRAAPNLAFGYGNLAVTDLAMQRWDEALKAALEANERLPTGPQVQVILAESLRQAGHNDEAIKILESVARATPASVRALYRLFELYHESPGGREKQIAGVLGRLVEEVPDNLSAELEWAQAAARVGQAKAALSALDRIERLAGSAAVDPSYLRHARAPLLAGNASAAVAPLAVLLNVCKPTPRFQQDRFVIEGEPSDPHGLLLREFSPPPPAALRSGPTPPLSVRFVDVSAKWGLNGTAAGKAGGGSVSGKLLAVADYDRDGKPDLFVADPGGHSRLWRNTGRRFVDVTAAAGLPALAATSAQFVDVDNDRLLDLVVTTASDIRYFHNTGARFVEATEKARLAGTGDARQALFADMDLDGNLDLLEVSRRGRNRLFLNLRNGRFADITAAAGLSEPLPGARAAVFGDFDNNGALDLLVLSDMAPSRLYLNQYGGRFLPAHGFGDSIPAGAAAAVVEDFDRDSYLDVAVVGRGPANQVLLHNEAGRRFKAEDGLKRALGSFSATCVTSIDYDNDGWRDLVVGGPHGLRLLRNLDGHHFQDRSDLLPPVSGALSVVAADVDGDGAPDLLVARPGGRVSLLRNQGGRRHQWVQIHTQDLAHNRDTPHSLHDLNNSYGIGNTVELKAGDLYQKRLVTEPLTDFGLGGAERADVLRVIMTNGTPQNMLLPAVDQLWAPTVHIVDSCPFLYAWDGSHYRFVTDVLWRGPLGLRVSADRFAPHDQTLDFVKIPHGVLQPTDGIYDLAISEELWETTYLDMARLVAVDHPAAADVFVDERMNFGPPLPFKLYTVQHPRTPKSVTDRRGRSWLREVAQRDGVYSHAFEPTRYKGVTKPSELVLDLGPLPPGAPVRLFLTGWIFPTGSSINVIASRDSKVRVIPPQIAVTDRRGRWKTIIPALGYPTGRNKTMVVEIGRFEGPEHRVKLTTTAELYWDQIFFTAGEAPAPVRVTSLAPAAADLHYLGFCREYRESEDGPFLYDHDRLEKGPRWRDQEGLFTRYGDVRPLLQRVDDQYVIMNAGDEVWMRFDGRRLAPLPDGWVRDFVMLTDGWDKDADPNTATCATVAPLPFHGMKRYPYGADERYPGREALRQYRATYNTRRVSARPFFEAIVRGQAPYPAGP
jgi:tetratricopeptide (TPR) repeat protein